MDIIIGPFELEPFEWTVAINSELSRKFLVHEDQPIATQIKAIKFSLTSWS